ncbi:hypothetical protein PILCRDRAFT_62472, partial [Piloderma croceum F 1598]
QVPLEKYFPQNLPVTSKKPRYISWRFMQANPARLSIYPLLLHTTDTSNIRSMFTAALDTKVRDALKDLDIV